LGESDSNAHDSDDDFGYVEPRGRKKIGALYPRVQMIHEEFEFDRLP